MKKQTFSINFSQEELNERSRIFALEKYIRNINKQEFKTPLMIEMLKEYKNELDILNSKKNSSK